MNNRQKKISLVLSAVLLAAALLPLLLSFISVGSGREEPAAKAQGRRAERRLDILERNMDKALESEEATWTGLQDLPQDMVVYRYVEDTLQSWANRFPIRSDDIRSSAVVRRLGESRSDAVSPLKNVTEEWTYISLGPKWYLMKSAREGDVMVIAGLEVINELGSGSLNGINRKLGISEQFSIKPLAFSVGAPVSVNGRPVFKISAENLSPNSGQNFALQLLALALLLAASLFFLGSRPSLRRLVIVGTVQTALLVWTYFRGMHASAGQLFSPLLYADGPLLYSLGAVIIQILNIVLLVTDIYIARRTLLREIIRKGSGALKWTLLGAGALTIVLIILYFHLVFRSITVNSDIVLELYKIPRVTIYSGVVYAAFIALALTAPVLLQLLSPLVKSLLGFRYNVFSVPVRAAFSVLIGVYFVSVTAYQGFRKEERRVEVWANRLAMDRDVALEIQLRSVESAIADDRMFGALASLEGGADVMRGRLVSNYMARISRDYDISVIQTGGNIGSSQLFQDRIRSGVRLSENSHFFYSPLGSGRAAYTGIFTWYIPGAGASSMMVSVESKRNREDRGYLRLLGVADPGRITLPSIYSWAKYVDGGMVQYTGSYAYPTVLTGSFLESGKAYFNLEGWCHFVRNVSEGEVIVISREQTAALDYVVSGLMLAILAFFVLSVIASGKGRSSSPRYYQNRISFILYMSLFLTLVAMAGFSVWFVYRRNVSDMQSVMVARVKTLQGTMQDAIRSTESIPDSGVRVEMERIGNSLHSDITLFDPSGRMVYSTTPEVYDRMILSPRIDDAPYYNIMYAHKRYFIQKERADKRVFHAMYAPVFNSGGKMVAILSSPFTNLTRDFQAQAVRHVATVITIFLLLLLLARVVTFEVVSRLFQPISQLSRKMKVTDVDHLEQLSYDGDDEITPLVDAYNRMVSDLGDSSRRLAQAERDKAWTDMARRVAHDLKNPLTPIKLQIQMLMRMKASGNPAWQDRLEEVTQTVLYHVDLLADSADQFSTFAKMYDQAPETFDLDALMRQEVGLFDSRDDVTIEYFGLSGAMVSAPKPQLTRVVVNLLTNAIQAVEGNEGEKRIQAALRNSADDGFYDIVVEDNGPGVPQEMVEKIFSPDFTTKTSGSGLGLAICRRIADHCGGSISYSRSFALGGACFTVKFPKIQASGSTPPR